MDTRWIDAFDERQCKEIALCRVYAKDYAHGTDGHNAKMIIAKMADLLDEAAQEEKEGQTHGPRT